MLYKGNYWWYIMMVFLTRSDKIIASAILGYELFSAVLSDKWIYLCQVSMIVCHNVI